MLFAGVAKAGFGSGGAFVASAILALLYGPGVALALMLPLLMLIDVATLRPYWRQWSTGDALLLVLGSLPGVALGAVLFRQADPDLLRLLIGVIALGFVGWQTAQRLRPAGRAARRLPLWTGVAAGTAAGFTSFVSHAGGPPAAVYLLSRNLTKTQYQATTVLIFNAINALKVLPYIALGLFSRETVVADLTLAPVALLGTWIGVRAHRVVPERLFFGLTYVLLAVTGCKLVWDGLT